VLIIQNLTNKLKVLLLTILAVLCFVAVVHAEEIGYFPSLRIYSYLNPFLQEREFWHDGTIALEGSDYDFESRDVRLRGRGNSTWFSGGAKRPLRLRFNGGMSMFGSAYAHRDWILLANHFDLGLMRNHGALHLAAQMSNIDFTPSSHFVHLYVNGEYMGVYQLVDERDIAPGRMPLTFDPDPAISEYMFELDGHLIGWRADEFVEGEDFFIVNEKAYDIRFPSDSLWDGHLEYLHAFVQNVSATLLTRDYEAIRALIDLDSFVDFYIVQEIFKSIDVGSFSVFMSLQGQGEDRRVHFGPVWDFDYSAGNGLNEPQPEGIWAAYTNYWFYNLLAVPEIRTLVVSRWNELVLAEITYTIEHLEYMAVLYHAEFERNFERHIMAYMLMLERTNPVTVHFSSFDEHVQFLIMWLRYRVDWLDAYFNERDPLPDSGLFLNYNPHEARLYLTMHLAPRINLSINGERPRLGHTIFPLYGRTLIELRDAFRLFGTYALVQETIDFYGYSFVELRMLVLGLGYEVSWDAYTYTVELRRPLQN